MEAFPKTKNAGTVDVLPTKNGIKKIVCVTECVQRERERERTIFLISSRYFPRLDLRRNCVNHNHLPNGL